MSGDMDPERLKEEYSSLLDGELSPEEREAIEAELADNAEALRELEHMKQVDQLYRQLPRQQAPAALGDRVHEAIQPRSKVTFGRKRSMRHAVWPMVLAAAAMVMIMVGYFVWLPQAGEPMRLASEPAAEAPQADRYSLEMAREAPALAEKGAPTMHDEAAEATEEGGFDEFDYRQGGSASGRAPGAAAPTGGGIGGLGGGIAGHEAPDAKGGFSGGMTRMKSAPEDGLRARGQMNGDSDDTGAVESEAAESAVADSKAARSDQAAPMALKEEPASAMLEALAAPPVEAAPPPPPPTPPADVSEDLNNPASSQMRQQTPPGPFLRGGAARPPAPAEAPLAMPAPEPAPPAEMEVLESVPAPDRAEQALGPPLKGVAPKAPGDVPAPMALSMPAEQRVAGERAFTLVDGVWMQQGYAGEETVALGEGSQALRERFEAVPDLRDLLTFDRPVVFRLDDAWYRLEPRQEKTVPE